MLKRGKKLSKIVEVLDKLINNQKLPVKYKEHKLVGNYEGFWECHIEPDWLLVYEKTEKDIFLTRTGTHSDLF
jgi:mRNA interferase YafQ